MASLLPNGKQIFVDANGTPLAGGYVFFYVPGTTTLKTTWEDPNQTTANTNPVVLDGAGGAVIYGSGQYRQVVQDLNGNQIWDDLTADPLTAIGPVTITGAATFGSSITVNGAAQFNGTASIAGTLGVAGKATLGEVVAGGSLSAANISSGGTLSVAGGGSVSGGWTVDNSLHMASGTFTADGSAVLNQGAIVSGAGLTVNDGLHVVSGGTQIDAGLTVFNSVNVATGSFTVAGGASVGAGLTVFNSLHMASGTFTADGSAVCNGGLTVSNSALVHGGLTVSDGATFAQGAATGSFGGWIMDNGGTGPSGGGSISYSLYANFGIVSNTLIVAASDARLKTEIETIDGEMGERFVMTNRPVRYLKRGVRGAGFVSQEMLANGFGEMVHSAPYAGLPERVEETGLTSPSDVALYIDYDQTHAYHQAALKRAYDKIAALEARLAAAGL